MCGAGAAGSWWWRRRAVLAWLWGAVVLAHLLTPATAGLLDTNPGLAYNFYRTSCPNAEAIVKSVVSAQVAANPALAGRLLRLHFHDCFVQVYAPEFRDSASFLSLSSTGRPECSAPTPHSIALLVFTSGRREESVSFPRQARN